MERCGLYDPDFYRENPGAYAPWSEGPVVPWVWAGRSATTGGSPANPRRDRTRSDIGHEPVQTTFVMLSH